MAKVIQEEDIERLMREAPDYILDASDEIKDLWVASAWAKELRDLAPERFYEVTLNEGTEKERFVQIDFQQVVNPGTVIKTYGGDTTDVRTVNAKRLHYLKLDRAYQRTVLELNKALGIRSHKPRNIVDYTGTILELLGKFYTIQDTAKVMAKEYRIKVPEEELKKFYVENRDIITRRRAEYVLQNKDFRIATETGRLEVLNNMLVEVELKNKQAGGSNVDYCNLIIKILEQARKEIKGNELKMTVDGKIDINASLHASDNVMSIMKTLSVNSIVIGLTAAKAGLNPAVLIGQLANSWYGKFNGFNGNIMDGEAVQLPSALIKQYDWGQLEAESKKFIGEFSPIGDIIDEQNPEGNEEAEGKRKDLLLRLKEIKMAKAKETERSNPVVGDTAPTTMLDEGVFAPQDQDKEPKGEFAIDYTLNKKYPQKRGMRVKGAIGESIARHKANKEEGVQSPTKLEAEARRKREARAKRRAAKKAKEKASLKDEE